VCVLRLIFVSLGGAVLHGRLVAVQVFAVDRSA
jgi:hypothetical protein